MNAAAYRIVGLVVCCLILAACEDRPDHPGPDEGIEVELPRAASGRLPAQVQPKVLVRCLNDQIFVSFADQSWKLSVPPSGAELQPLVKVLRARASLVDAQVIIYAQPSMEYGTVIAVMDALHAAGLLRMSLAVSVDGKH